MKSAITLLVCILLSVSLYAQNYKQVKIFIDENNTIYKLQKLGIDDDHFSFEKDNSIITFVSDKDFLKLKNSSFNYQVLIDDWFTYYNSRTQLTELEKQSFIQHSKENFNVDGFGFGSMGGFYTFNEIIANIDSMYVRYPNLITQKFQIGLSQEGRPIWAVKISDNPNINENEPKVGYDALIHAREPASMSSLLYFMWYLLQNYGTNSEVTYLVNNREMFFVPCFNPDGYEYNRQTYPNGGGMWRKNRRNNGGSFGVDLNRNFGYMWGYDNLGSSPDPSSETYRGPFAFSEPEAQAVRNLAIQHNYKTHFNMHSYQNAFIYPWGYISQLTPDSSTYREFATDMCAFNEYTHGNSNQVLGYNSNGSVRDWFYGDITSKEKAFGYTVEIGSSTDGFWPQMNRIFPLAQGMLQPNLYNAWVAGEHISVTSTSFSQQYFNPGDQVQLNVLNVRNKGLSNANNISLQLTADNSQITINSNQINVGNIPARSTVNVNQHFIFTVGNIPPETQVKFYITSYKESEPLRTDTLKIIIGTPTLLFSDTTNNPINLWTVTSTPSNPTWGITTSTFVSAPNSYTDSPVGNYANSATVTLTSKNPINLSGYSNPKLSFWSRWDIENNWDYGQVRISTNNGVSWVSLQGNYTNPASGQGVQTPAGMPVYDGIQNSWVKEEINLTGLTSPEARLRFELKTDNSIIKDGWYLDDISIYVYTIIPVELSSFEAFLSGNRIQLIWSTSSELNNLGFEIQRKVLGTNSDWIKIGFVNGKGTTTEKINYSFTDSNPETGIILYRLKQIDIDGSYKILPTVSVNYDVPSEFVLEQNYPNPFAAGGGSTYGGNPGTTISWQSPVGSWQTIKLYNSLGEEIDTIVDGYYEAGKHSTFYILHSTLPSGVYFYQLRAGDFVQTKKMMIMR